jgi:hypothetical protein
VVEDAWDGSNAGVDEALYAGLGAVEGLQLAKAVVARACRASGCHRIGGSAHHSEQKFLWFAWFNLFWHVAEVRVGLPFSGRQVRVFVLILRIEKDM